MSSLTRTMGRAMKRNQNSGKDYRTHKRTVREGIKDQKAKRAESKAAKRELLRAKVETKARKREAK